MKTKTKTTRKRAYPILQQIVQYLPEWTLEKLANKHGVDARSFSATSHVVALMIAHLAHTSSLNETCDVCAMHEKKLRYVRNVTPPHRNTLSNANRTRPAAMAEELFWTVKAALETNNVTVNGKTFNQRGSPRRVVVVGAFHHDDRRKKARDVQHVPELLLVHRTDIARLVQA